MSRILTNFRSLNSQLKRWRHKENHWTLQKKKKQSSQKALDHFDEFYEQIFKAKWAAIRKALLSKQKYVAVVNNYSDVEETCAELEKRAAFNVRKLFTFQQVLLSEKMEEEKRKNSLERIWKMDEALTDKVEEEKKPHVSLEKGLKDAQFDNSRIIDGHLSSGILYEYVPTTKIKGREDFIEETHYYKQYERNAIFPLAIEKEYSLNFPDHLNVYSYEEESLTEFPQPKKGSTGVFNYYLMDGGSLLPVLALDIKPGNTMLDMCSAPGGKSYVALQTLFLKRLVCNDSSISRTNRINNVLNQYFYDLKERWLKPGIIDISCRDARFIKDESYDRILVDVPCTTDRHSVNVDDNNIFRADRVKERLKLPELQSEILYNALRLVNVGGVVVYSTCSLSPIQNDGVIHMALKKLWDDTKSEFVIKDLTPCLMQVKDVYNLAGQKILKYGHLVIPSTTQNFGPTYFCKLQRVT